MFIDKLNKAATYSSQEGRTTYGYHSLGWMIWT